MWERAESMPSEARQFARAHGLEAHVDHPAPLPAGTEHSFPAQRTHCVSGQWRGRHVQRFFGAGATVELMTLPSELPLLQVIPTGTDCGSLAVGGRAIATGEPAFDSRFQVVTDDPAFALAFLTPSVREAIAHPAAAGRVLTVAGGAVSTHVVGQAPWVEARVRFEFLAVIVGRVDGAVWRDFDRSRVVVDGWMPGPDEMAASAGPHFAVAPMPQPVDDDDRLSATGEFEVAALAAELDGTTFVPHGDPERLEPQWTYAPLAR